MSDEAIEAVLAEFRTWLRANGDAEASPPDLVGEFTALRHEVKLLTRAARAQNEQIAALLQVNDPPADETESAEDRRPFLMAVVELLDTLDRSLEGAGRLANEWTRHERGSWWPFGRGKERDRAGEQLRALADGLSLARNRIALNVGRLELTPVEAAGEPFDPETMEVLEAVAHSARPAGTVLEVVRSGYLWRGRPLRFAQVRVAK